MEKEEWDSVGEGVVMGEAGRTGESVCGECGRKEEIERRARDECEYILSEELFMDIPNLLFHVDEFISLLM